MLVQSTRWVPEELFCPKYCLELDEVEQLSVLTPNSEEGSMI